MRATELWPRDTKFIEIGARAELLGKRLVAAGFDRYLGVVAREADRARLAGADSSLAPYLTVEPGRRAVRNNNADVLLLGGHAALSTLSFRNLRHARWVALPGRFDVRLLAAFAACLCHVVLRRLDAPRLVDVDAAGGNARIVAFRVRKRRLARGARHYVPHRLGIEGLLKRLLNQDIRHVVLRWFEWLPKLPDGEDLDVLVGDDHLPRVLAMLDEGPGIKPCDIYSETGLPRSDFRKMPYFPPRLAGQLLNGAVVHNGVCRVPNAEHHFLSLAYHALYHKGPASGIPTRLPGRRKPKRAEHDYTHILANLAARRQIDVEMTREGLDAYLERHAWRPPRDMLVRLGRRNRWIRQSMRAAGMHSADRGLAVFIVRREAMHRGGMERLAGLLEPCGFSILKTKVLEEHQLKHVADNIRGGNWGRGPWGTSGGPPAAVIVAYDPHPQPLTWRQRRKFPLADNARLLEKSRIRDALNEGFPTEQHCNVLHSSDNGVEAWEYIAIAMPEDDAEIRNTLGAWQNAYHTAAPVLQDLTRYGVRAKIELVAYQGRPAVRKTFKPGRERFCRREEFAMRELSRAVPQIPPLVAADENSVIYPFYNDVLRYQRSSGWLVPLDVARQAIEALQNVYKAGYALVDASVDNIIVDRHQGLKLIDFEFLHCYQQRPDSFGHSYDVAGCPADFPGDLPSGGGKNYRRHWMPYTGLSLDSLLGDPRWIQHVKRTLYVAIRPHRYFPRRIRHYYRQAAAALSRHFARAPGSVKPGSLIEPAVPSNNETKRAA